jgi:glucokinase
MQEVLSSAPDVADIPSSNRALFVFDNPDRNAIFLPLAIGNCLHGTVMKKAYAGIDLGGTNIKYGLCRPDGKTIIFRTIPALVEEGTQKLLKRIRACAGELLEDAATKNLKVHHIGIGTPGIVDATTGKIAGMAPNIPGWVGCNPKTYLESKIDIRVSVDNDANVMALAESLFGAAKGCRNVIFTTVGTGIGGGILLDGRLYRGSTGGAGEFGHMTIVKDGRQCNCGRSGCLESYAAAPHLLEMATKMVTDTDADSVLVPVLKETGRLTVKDVFDAFKRHSDPVAEKVIQLSAEYLACGLASVSAVLVPQIVVIGGGVADAGGAAYVKLVRKALRELALQPLSSRIRVVKARLGNRAGVVGAAILGDYI